jgi:hypothetical protein
MRRVRRLFGPPLGLGLLAAAVVFTTCALDGHSPFRTRTWDRADPLLYLDIARHGFTLSRCPPPDVWCGNAGWFPAYPWLTAIGGRLGVGIAPAALALTWLFTLGALVLLWATFLERRLEAGAVVALVYAAFAPGVVFEYAMYPLSMLAFFSIAYLWLVVRERWLWAGLAGAVAVLTYPVGIAAPVAVAAYVLVAYRRAPVSKRLSLLGLAVGPAAVSISLLLLVLQLSVGHWNAYFLVQHKYGHQVREPFASIIHAATSLIHVESWSLGTFSLLQTLLVSAVLFSVVALAARQGRAVRRVDLLVVLWALTTWLMPSATSHLAGHRGETALLPLAILVARLPLRLAAVYAVAAAAITAPNVVFYLQGALS